ncbi:hypothetical protein MNBD_GAMMA24-627 [hydrothermal vent metagenome]|uniref:Lcl C-terminal domain-containing protein n=1 Tax=hydrothermal vent metagenome TaxID=652676 RepID=A0A3B1B6N3_9ZZZZ
MIRLMTFCLCLLFAGIPPVQAQTCNNAIPASAPASRYQVHANGTVTDRQTGLMWKQCAEGLSGAECATGKAATLTWQQALQRSSTLNVSGGFAGHTDWRLPNLKELQSLREVSCYSPAINTTIFPSTGGLSVFWSSSPGANVSNNAWYVFFDDGNSYNDDRSFNFRVRLVRSGQ